jgi:hypothetical protein
MVYNQGIGMDRPMGEQFGMMSLACQAIQINSFHHMLGMPTPLPTRTGADSGRRISRTKQGSWQPTIRERDMGRKEL